MAMQARGVLESALYVSDLDEAEAFYGGVLGLEKIARMDPRMIVFRCGNGVVLLFNAAETVKPPEPGALPVPPHGATGQGHLAFTATAGEIEQWRAYLEENGVAIESDFEWPKGGRSIYFRDPSGNSLEFTEPRIWGL